MKIVILILFIFCACCGKREFDIKCKDKDGNVLYEGVGYNYMGKDYTSAFKTENGSIVRLTGATCIAIQKNRRE